MLTQQKNDSKHSFFLLLPLFVFCLLFAYFRWFIGKSTKKKQTKTNKHKKHTNTYLKTGDMTFYESSKLIHGRPSSFNGTSWVNAFLHFRPKDWDTLGYIFTPQNVVKTPQGFQINLFSFNFMFVFFCICDK